MTATTDRPTTDAVELLTVTIDGVEVQVPKGTLIIRAAERAGIQIPRFCDHPLLKPAGACRQCLVDVAMPDREGNVKPMPKPQTSCTMEVAPGMVVATQHTSDVADKAQHGIMEFLLINHPLDCPVCDKGGECPLQNQAMSNGRSATRFVDIKRTFPKPLKISTQILLDRDRCILCQRCTRFSDEIAGDPFIALQGRGGGAPGRERHALNGSQIGTFDSKVLGIVDDDEVPVVRAVDLTGPDGEAGVAGSLSSGPLGAAGMDSSGRPFASYFSGNTIQICPVGALTSASYRFRARPFDLVSTASVAEHDAGGSDIRVDHRRGTVVRRLAGNDPEVNEEWITDKDRFAFTWQSAPDRLTLPLVREEETGELVPTSWSEALDIAATALAAARADGGVGLLPGGRLTLEDSYAWSKFARVALGTNDIDHRSRVHSAEEAQFLAQHVAGRGLGVTFGDLERAGQVLLVGLEPEEESGTIFLRLRKGMLAGTVKVATIAPFATRGATKMRAQLVTAAPGTEPEVVDAVRAASSEPELAELAARLAAPGAVILVGERAAAVRGTLTAVVALAERTGARLAWVPRRAGEVGAVEAGLLPGLLPAGRQVADAGARVDAGAVGVSSSCPASPAGTSAASCAPPARGRSRRSSSAVSSRSTCPTRPWPARPSPPPGSSSSSRCAARRSPSTPTSSCPSRRRWRRPARSSAGRVAAVRSARSWSPGRCRTVRSCRASPPRWAWTCAWATSRPCTPSSASSPAGKVPDPAPPRWSPPPCRRPARARPSWPPGSSSSTPDASRTASRTSPAPPTGRSPGSRRRPPPVSAWPRAPR
ncbi:NADH-quinone oxidoreductase subunit G [Georgenia muralis]